MADLFVTALSEEARRWRHLEAPISWHFIPSEAYDVAQTLVLKEIMGDQLTHARLTYASKNDKKQGRGMAAWKPFKE